MTTLLRFNGLSRLLPLAVFFFMIGGSTVIADEESGSPAPTEETTTEDDAAAAVAAAADEAAAPEFYEKKEIDYTVNTLIMFVCAVLVLFMQAGFAMVEVGFNASKNAVNIIEKGHP